MLIIPYKDKVGNKLFVVDTEVESLLSGNSCSKLGLPKRVYQLTGQDLPSNEWSWRTIQNCSLD